MSDEDRLTAMEQHAAEVMAECKYVWRELDKEIDKRCAAEAERDALRVAHDRWKSEALRHAANYESQFHANAVLRAQRDALNPPQVCQNDQRTGQAVTLTGFLLARIAEDEAEAVSRREALHFAFGDGSPFGDESLYHRLLAECEAKRRIVRESGDLARPHRAPSPWPDAEVSLWICQECGRPCNDGRDCPVDWRPPSRVLRALAHPYADHAEYDITWSLTADALG